MTGVKIGDMVLERRSGVQSDKIIIIITYINANHTTEEYFVLLATARTSALSNKGILEGRRRRRVYE